MYVIIKFIDYNIYNQIKKFIYNNPIKHRCVNKLEYKNVTDDEINELIKYVNSLDNDIKQRIIIKIKYILII